jgi:spore coat protein CotH
MHNKHLRTTAITLSLAALVATTSLPAGAGTLHAHTGRAAGTPTATPMATPTKAMTTTPQATATPVPKATAAPKSDGKKRPAGWTDETHGNKAAPNYDVVFPVNAVNTLTITIAPDDWAAMEADMEDIYAQSVYIRKAILAAGSMTKEERDKLFLELVAQGAKERSKAQATNAAEPVTSTQSVSTTGVLTDAVDAPARREQMTTNRSPKWVPATITFKDQEWQHVGVRYKGASSLSPWIMGEMRLPFKFDFDQFEDDYPEIDNQRFFGFKELSLANNYDDPAGMRDTLVYEMLNEAGLPSVQTSPYELVLDYGEGPVRLGLYTMVEVIDDTGVPSYFGSDKGNIYEGEGWGVSLATQDSHLLEDSFEKKNNDEKEDWSDIWALYEALNSEKRTKAPAVWRKELEAVFDVDGFLEWLGIAAMVGHADTYGNAYHNFYLYNDPQTGRLNWFSWDHNLTLRKDLLAAVTLDKAKVTDAWPLIRFLLDDPVYKDRYVKLMAENFANVLNPERVIERALIQAEVVKPVATKDMSEEAYDEAVQAIVDFVEARSAEVEDFLKAQGVELNAAPATAEDEINRPADWTDETHGNKAAPNYDVVFPVDAVNTLTITIAPDDWTDMQQDMAEIYAASLWIREAMLAAGPMTPEEREAFLVKLFTDRAKVQAASASKPVTATAPIAGGRELASRSPRWVPATITFKDQEWTHVGVRYKGASSLSPWTLGDLRLPFKFDFDQFEDDYPEIDNQRFFGFKQLALANNYQDPAGMRDTLVYELLGEAGLPSLRTAPYEIVLDYGEGPMRLGLYTVVEVVDDTGIRSNFGSDDGNIYEGDGPGASLSHTIPELIEKDFEKKNNEEKEDWGDIWALYEALHSEKRASDPEAWRTDLERVFDVDGFLEWLGIAQVVGHGDTYGIGPHNFYLYNDPETSRLTWFSWDHNLTFKEDVRAKLALDKANVSDAWPLIRFLLNDPIYKERYAQLMADNFDTVLKPETVIERVRARAEVIKPFATQEMSEEEYDKAVQAIVDFVEARAKDVEAFLAKQK